MSYRLAIPAAVLLFVVTACFFLPYAGIQADEAIFASGIYDRRGVADLVHIRTPFLKVETPLMLMSYLGALKAWLYAFLFKLVAPSVVAVRLPMILAAAATVWLFAWLLRVAAGADAALVGCILLATDTTFLLTSCYDWGPVVLQHILVVAGFLAVFRFYHSRRPLWLQLGFFLFGLALWDKALALWMLSGIGLGTLLFFRREVHRCLTWPNLAVSGLAFGLGAFPLILYNVRHPWATFRQDTSFSWANLEEKPAMLRITFEGHGLLGYLIRMEPDDAPRRPEGALERVSIALDRAFPGERRNLTWEAVLAAVLLVPVWWGSPHRRAMLAAAVAFAVAWVLMVFGKNTGGSLHHTILLWPLPQFFLALALAAVSARIRKARGFALAAVLLLASANLLTTNRQFARLVVNGPGAVWSDAIFPLHDYLRTVEAQQIFTTDWGLLDPLMLLSRGRLPLRVGEDPVSRKDLTAAERAMVVTWFTPDNLFIGHTDGNEQFVGINESFRELAAAAGFRREVLKVIHDRNGRPIFEVLRFLQR